MRACVRSPDTRLSVPEALEQFSRCDNTSSPLPDPRAAAATCEGALAAGCGGFKMGGLLQLCVEDTEPNLVHKGTGYNHGTVAYATPRRGKTREAGRTHSTCVP